MSKEGYLCVGDDVSNLKIYEIINKYFGENYKGFMQAWYDIDDEYYGLQHPHDYICIAVGTSDYKTRRYCDSSWADCGLIQAALVTLVHNDLQHSCGKQARMARFEHGERG